MRVYLRVGIYSRAAACECVPWYLDRLLNPKPVDHTARSFPPVSSSTPAWLICFSFCLLLSCDVCDVPHVPPIRGRCLITKPVLSPVARRAVNLVTDNPQGQRWGCPLLDMPGCHPVPPRLLLSRGRAGWAGMAQRGSSGPRAW